MRPNVTKNSISICLFRLKEEEYGPQEIRPALQPTDRNLPHCPCCKLAVWDGENYKEKIPRSVIFVLTFDLKTGVQN